MSTINLGNIVGNKVIGIASGLDTTTLITDLAKTRQQPIDDLNTKITANTDKVTAIGKLNSLLTTFQTSLNFLRNPLGFNSDSSNIFQYRTASLTSPTLTASNYLSVSANPGALVGDTTIQIKQLATALEQRSGSFNARDLSATTSSTGSYFNAGTFQIGSALASSVAATTNATPTLASADYSVNGSGTGILTSDGIKNITVTGASGGDTNLQGTVKNFTGTLGSGIGIFTVVVNGVTYVSNSVDVTQSVNSGADQGIAAGTTITFTSNSGGANETSFQVTTGSDFAIDNDQTNVDSFATALGSGVSGQTILQSRSITSFNNANVKAPITGLTSANIKFASGSYGTSGSIGTISGFTAQKSTGSDGSLSVTINGETFRAIGLGTTLNSNITLQSTTSNKTLSLNLGDAGISVDFSTDAAASEFGKTLDYAFGSRQLVNITVNSGDTLNDVIYNINNASSQTGSSAAVTKISDSSYVFTLKANTEGLDNSYEIFDNSGVLTNAGLSTTKSAQNSVIKVDGSEITRSTNTITDAIEDVTLNLQGVTPNYSDPSPDTITLSVDNDVDNAATAVGNFIDAYNALRVFYTEQTARDSSTGAYTKDAVLGGDSNLENLINQVGTAINTIVSTSNTNFDSLADLGIQMQDYQGDDSTVATKNILQYDATTLKSILTANFDKVRQIFEFNSSTDSNDLSVSQSSNQTTITSFKLSFDYSKPVGQQVQLLNSDGSVYLKGGQPVYLDVSGTKISGRDDTPLAGMTFLYTGDGSAQTISVNITQGIADNLYNTTTSYIKDGGILDSEITNLNSSNDDYKDQITSLQDRLDAYTAQLQDKFDALESALSSVNNILSFLDATQQAQNQK